MSFIPHYTQYLDISYQVFIIKMINVCVNHLLFGGEQNSATGTAALSLFRGKGEGGQNPATGPAPPRQS